MLKTIELITQQPIVLADPTWMQRHEEIRMWSRTGRLQCPSCHTQVVFKAGVVRSWHFAHKHRHDCALANTSAAQLAGRELLYRFLKTKFPDATIEVEYLLPDTSIVIDCVVYHAEYRVAYILLDQQIRKVDLREELVRQLLAFSPHHTVLFLRPLLSITPSPDSIELSTTERDFMVRTRYDNLGNSRFQREPGQTLHYLDVAQQTLTTYRNLCPTFHSPQTYHGLAKTTALDAVLVTAKGELVHPGEREQYQVWKTEQDKKEINERRRRSDNVTVVTDRSNERGPRYTPPAKIHKPPTPDTSNKNKDNVTLPKTTISLLPATTSSFQPPIRTSTNNYIIRFVTPREVTTNFPKTFSDLAECQAEAQSALAHYAIGTKAYILDGDTGTIIDVLLHGESVFNTNPKNIPNYGDAMAKVEEGVNLPVPSNATLIEMSFDEAVLHVTEELGTAYAYLPEMQRGREVGVAIYLLAYFEPTDDPEDDWAYMLYYVAGKYKDSDVEEGSYGPDEIPLEARQLLYRPAPLEAEDWLHYEVSVIKALLDGWSFEDVMADY